MMFIVQASLVMFVNLSSIDYRNMFIVQATGGRTIKLFKAVIIAYRNKLECLSLPPKFNIYYKAFYEILTSRGMYYKTLYCWND